MEKSLKFVSKKMQFQPVQKRLTLAEQIAQKIKQSILAGEIQAGEVLPTEPELAAQFGISHSVVHDAARILLALGLVDIRHGKGMFVTENNIEPFQEAVKLALCRDRATVWDVDEMERLVFPEACAMACRFGGTEAKQQLRERADAYIKAFAEINWHCFEEKREEAPAEIAQLNILADEYKVHIYRMAGNKLFLLLGQTIQRPRQLRNWYNPLRKETSREDVAAFIRFEEEFFYKTQELIDSGRPEKVATQVKHMMELPPKAIEIMKVTPVDRIPQIPVTPAEYRAYLKERGL